MLFKTGYVYIITNWKHTVLYTGVTNNLNRRTNEHKTKFNPGCFTSKYNCSKLVYYARFSFIRQAITEEKRIKAGSRAKKILLINNMNPEWRDLWDEVKEWG